MFLNVSHFAVELVADVSAFLFYLASFCWLCKATSPRNEVR